ncbi:lysosomal cholesterol signaling protein-like [Centruroides vittatus]|uniref:lysosomal cholesterol signaling protein-like n=1 Tax=Centruroides vittatus TaxID=120091 RepID=UPI00350EA4A5
MANKGNSTSIGKENIFDEYIPALSKCIVTIILGYANGRFKLFSEIDAKGMNKFVIYWILPFALYLKVANSDLNVVRWKMIGAIMVTKVIIFVGIVSFHMVWKCKRKLVDGGIYAMLCAVSNDAALGNVLVQALYSTLHPDLPLHLFLIQPISILLFQPIALTMAKTSRIDNCGRTHFWLVCTKSIWISMRNPLVLALVLGLITSAWIPKPLPYLFVYVLNVIATALPANVLFVLGMSMVGKFQLIFQTKYHSTVITCFFLKMLATPIILRLITSNLSFLEDKDADFSFVYGVMIPYNGVLVFANEFGISLYPIQIILTLSALSFFPFTYVTALSTVNNLIGFERCLNDVYFYYNVVNLTFGFLTCMVNFRRKNKSSDIFIWFVVSQMVLSTGNMLIVGHSFIMPDIQKVISLFGQVMCNFWTANLAAQIHLKVNKRRYFLLVGFGIPTSLTASILFFNVYKYPNKIPKNFMDNKMAIGATLVNVLCALLIIIVFLSLYIRHKNTICEEVPENVTTLYIIAANEFSSTDHLNHSSQRNVCPEEVSDTVPDNSQTDNLFRFLIILATSMTLRLFLQLFKITDKNKDGVFVIVKFLADFSSSGQALLAFMWFEFKMKTILAVFKKRRSYKVFSLGKSTR